MGGTSALEVELAAELQNPRISCAGNLSGTARIWSTKALTRGRRRQISVYVRPLCVVEDVEEFEAELQPGPLVKVNVLEQGHIPVVDTRSLEEVAANCSKPSIRGAREDTRVEPRRILTRRNAMRVVGVR